MKNPKELNILEIFIYDTKANLRVYERTWKLVEFEERLITDLKEEDYQFEISAINNICESGHDNLLEAILNVPQEIIETLDVIILLEAGLNLCKVANMYQSFRIAFRIGQIPKSIV